MSDTTSRATVNISKKISYHYDLDSLESLKNNLLNGYIDTFTILNRQYKIYYESTTYDSLAINYFDKNCWIKNVKLKAADEFERKIDFNNDGFNDIHSQAQGWNFINFYLPNKKIFSKQFKLPGDNEIMIDSSKKLYANFREPYHQCNFYNSQLIDYNKSLPTIHFLLSGETFYVDGNCIMDSIKIIKLFKYNQQKDTLILLESFKPKSSKFFEYESYWKKNYKRLMGYR